MMGEGMYVVGTEPCTSPLYPRSELRKQGKLEFIQPGEERRTERRRKIAGSRRVEQNRIVR